MGGVKAKRNKAARVTVAIKKKFLSATVHGMKMELVRLLKTLLPVALSGMGTSRCCFPLSRRFHAMLLILIIFTLNVLSSVLGLRHVRAIKD